MSRDTTSDLVPATDTTLDVYAKSSSNRLFLDTTSRVRFAVVFASLAGGVLGFSHGAQNAGFRFRAENAHRLPTSEKGWYFYHKTKNYSIMQGGIKEGGRMALKLGSWSGLFFLTEAAVDKRRDSKDAASSVCAGMAVAGAFSLWNRLPMTTAARTTKLGLYAGLICGLTQDGLALLQGQKVSYVEGLRKLMKGGPSHETSHV